MLTVLNRSYKDHLGRTIVGNMPIANQGDKATYSVDYEVYFGFSLSYNLSISRTAGSNTVTLNGANWGDYGFSAGDTVFFTGLQDTTGGIHADGSFVINIISGNQAIVSTTTSNSVILIAGEGYTLKSPQAVKSKINLIPSDLDSGTASLIDATSLSFVHNSISSMSVNDVLPLSLIGDLSGGGVLSATIKRLADTRDGKAKSYRIEVEFYWWLYLSNFAPEFFSSACTTPYFYTSFLPQWNNPSVSLEGGFKPIGDGNSGFRNENFNENPSNFEIRSVVFSQNGHNVNGFDYSKPTDFVIKVENMSGGGFGIDSGIIFFNDIEDSDEYSADGLNDKGLYSHLNHTLFLERGTLKDGISQNIYSFSGPDGSSLQCIVTVTIAGNIATYTGTFTPNPEFVARYSDPNNNERTFILLVRNESLSFGASNYSDTVNTLVWRGVADDYPPFLGGYFTSAILNDHANNLIYTY